MKRKLIPVEKTFAKWRKDPEYVAAYRSVTGQLVLVVVAGLLGPLLAWPTRLRIPQVVGELVGEFADLSIRGIAAIDFADLGLRGHAGDGVHGDLHAFRRSRQPHLGESGTEAGLAGDE